MKKTRNIYLMLFSVILTFLGCQENDYKFGDIVTPTNITITADVVGADADNPFGDGSGTVNFTVSAANSSSYVFYFDGAPEAAPSGTITKRFSKVGVNTYTVIVKANGTGGVSSTKSIDVEVFSSFSDVEAEDFLSGANVGDSKKWYWQADQDLHVGLGPVADDYGNGEFAYEAWWNGIRAWDAEKSCMYDNEFVFTRTANGLTFEQTTGPAFVPGTYAGYLGVDGDQCHDESVTPNIYGVKTVSFGPSTSKAALEGSYNENPYRGTTFDISEGGFMGWFVGSGTYDIISVSSTELIVRVIEDPSSGTGAAWYHKFTSTKPTQSAGYTFNDLAWEDDFNTDGAPDATKWTYDLGAGGWGNGELQTYTNESENVIVENGSLKIIAKANGAAYTSARLKSQGLYEFTYGRVEVRAKLPASQGTWPAIWMLGSNFTTVGWPESGEIDIMEQKGQDKNTVLSTIHYPENSAGNGPSQSIELSTSTTEFHNYSVEWTDTKIEFYVDDVSYHVLSNDESLPFNADFFLILNVAMGGTLGGDVDPGFTEDLMEIDYVKVFQ
ncbi:family 16 glycosylhydrolase [Polaribacter litorisediminis]|uniref:family 16 glycosylhydrolase n=1 Tax=Polaribacter litorisediminis TaxID=1908341 RepID=UPI001CC182BC|nr:family 16 glycosylhydrolase [Polaribacter litorisediminis]UAM99173.1 family 16 glycosylhydrolase [Polaribacter litorisediminis]